MPHLRRIASPCSSALDSSASFAVTPRRTASSTPPALAPLASTSRHHWRHNSCRPWCHQAGRGQRLRRAFVFVLTRSGGDPLEVDTEITVVSALSSKKAGSSGLRPFDNWL